MTLSADIRAATQQDIVLIQRLGRETFYETFAASNSEADMQQYLEEHFSESRVTEEVNTLCSQFFIAYWDHVPVGYLKLNWSAEQTELQDEDALEIERIYVKSSHQGNRIGQALFEKALQQAKSTAKHYVWLAVWEKNEKAIRFYEKNGFKAFDKHSFQLGSDKQVDIMMKKLII